MAYAYWLRETSPEVSVFWVHASNRQRFRQAFTSIAQVCGIPGYDGKKADTLLLVKQWLESDKSGPWLLIIDNADDKDVFFTDSREDVVGVNASSPVSEERLGRFIPECLHGSVLITTRDMQTGLRMTAGAGPIEVNKMGDDEAVELLQSLLPNHNFSPSEAIALAFRLEYLPLALAQAASFILKNFMSINDYVQILNKSDTSLVRQLSEPFASIGRDSETPHALTATWLISFRQIEQRHPLAGNLLSFMSMFDRQAIPKDLVEEYCHEQLRDKSDSVVEVDGHFEGDSGIGSDYNSDSETASAGSDASSDAGSETTLEVANALGILQAFSFISQARNDTYDMHRLVHLVTRKRLLQETTMLHFTSEALKIIARTFPLGQFENRVACLTYLPHALALLVRFNPQSDEAKIQTGKLLYNVAGYFEYLGQDLETEKHLKRALDLRRAVFGQDHPATLNTMSALASCHKRQNHVEVAVKLLLPTLEAQKKLLKESDTDVIYTRRQLAGAYLHQGRLGEAEKLYLEALEICKKAGEERRRMTNVLGELSAVYFEQRRYEEAEKLQLKVLERDIYAFGEDSEETLWTMRKLGLTYSRQGRLPEAEDMLSRTLIRSRTLMGEEHPTTVKLMMHLGLLYLEQGRLTAAEELQSKVLYFRKSSMGEEHEDTVWAMVDLGNIYQKQGRRVEAEKLFLKVLEIRKTILGEEHESTALIMGDLALLYSDQDRLVEAEELQQRVLKLRKKISGEDHIETLTQENNLAWTWWDQGRKEEAIQLMRKCAESRESVLGRDHKHTNSSLKALFRWEKEVETENSSENESGSASEDSSGDGEDAYVHVGSDDESDDGEGVRL